jgi:uncharacterized protein DUF3551
MSAMHRLHRRDSGSRRVRRRRSDELENESLYKRFRGRRFLSRKLATLRLERNMKTIHRVAIATTVAFSALALVAMAGSTAQAGPIVPPRRYCLSYDKGGTDCSFTSYAQCLATASGIAAECYGKTIRDDEDDAGFQVRGHRGSEFRTPYLTQGARQNSLPASLSWSVHPTRHQFCRSGQTISTRQPGPERIAIRKPCSFTIAATKFRPRPTPGVFRILSER